MKLVLSVFAFVLFALAVLLPPPQVDYRTRCIAAGLACATAALLFPL